MKPNQVSCGDVPSMKEPTGISRSDGKRPDGTTLIPWKRGRMLLWDATVVDTFATSYIKKTSMNAGSAAKLVENKKVQKYQSLLSEYYFVPVAIETGGSWGKDGLRFVKEIGQRITTSTGDQRATSFLIQRISIAIQRGNAISIVGTLPQGKSLDDIMYF